MYTLSQGNKLNLSEFDDTSPAFNVQNFGEDKDHPLWN